MLCESQSRTPLAEVIRITDEYGLSRDSEHFANDSMWIGYVMQSTEFAYQIERSIREGETIAIPIDELLERKTFCISLLSKMDRRLNTDNLNLRMRFFDQEKPAAGSRTDIKHRLRSKIP